jgi:hypothetical protein
MVPKISNVPESSEGKPTALGLGGPREPHELAGCVAKWDGGTPPPLLLILQLYIVYQVVLLHLLRGLPHL